MFALNDDDLLLIKYMMITSLSADKDILKNAKHLDEITELLIKEFDKAIVDNLIKEALYYGNLFSLLHTKNSCPKEFENTEWGSSIFDEILLFVRLYQQLDLDEFSNMLEMCINISLEEFQDLKLNIEELSDTDYIERIIEWLERNKNSFAENVKRMLQIRKVRKDSPIMEVTNNISPIRRDIPIMVVTNNISPIRRDSPIMVATNNISPIRRGMCVVISNKYFDNGVRRNGTEVDEANIDNTFTPLGYEVQISCNATYSDMMTIIDKTKANVLKSDGILIFFILSHGKNKCVLTTDGSEIPFDLIWKKFSNDNFQEFGGKPKLFFFVCCQGNELNRAIEIEHDGPSAERSVPTMSDFFFGYATCEEYLSYRTPTKGTYYVDCLCQVIRDCPSDSICDIHQEVQRRLTCIMVQVSHGITFQMPCYMNVLRHNVYLTD